MQKKCIINVVINIIFCCRSVLGKESVEETVALKGAESQAESAWPLGIIPYFVNTEVYDSIIESRIESAMNLISTSSCIQFKKLIRPRYHTFWLHFNNPDRTRECNHMSYDETRGRFSTPEVVVTLGFDCMQHVDILRAILHAIGFNNEVTHPQRNSFVRIVWENIQPQYWKLFNIKTDSIVMVEYDPLSVMHFHDRAFSSNGGATIEPLIPGLVIKPTETMSLLDKMKLRIAFGHECNKRKIGNLLEICKNVFHENASKNQTHEDNEDK